MTSSNSNGYTADARWSNGFERWVSRLAAASRSVSMMLVITALFAGFHTPSAIADGKKDETVIAKLERPLKGKVAKSLLQTLRQENASVIKEWTGGAQLNMSFLSEHFQDMALGISTSDCPANCNDSVSGGYCRCNKQGDPPKCPSGTTETGGGGYECRADPKRGIVTGGFISQPVVVTP